MCAFQEKFERTLADNRTHLLSAMRLHRILACVGAFLGAASCVPSSIDSSSPEDLLSVTNTTDPLTVAGLLNGTVPSSLA